jgi:hypothetical protein
VEARIDVSTLYYWASGHRYVESIYCVHFPGLSNTFSSLNVSSLKMETLQFETSVTIHRRRSLIPKLRTVKSVVVRGMRTDTRTVLREFWHELHSGRLRGLSFANSRHKQMQYKTSPPRPYYVIFTGYKSCASFDWTTKGFRCGRTGECYVTSWWVAGRKCLHFQAARGIAFRNFLLLNMNTADSFETSWPFFEVCAAV